jgi:hypothetical protein
MYELGLTFPDPVMQPNGYMYMVLFSHGTVKIGRTNNPFQRIQSYFGSAGRMGRTLQEIWLSPAYQRITRVETLVLNEIHKGQPVSRGTEYFPHLPLGHVRNAWSKVGISVAQTFRPVYDIHDFDRWEGLRQENRRLTLKKRVERMST